MIMRNSTLCVSAASFPARTHSLLDLSGDVHYNNNLLRKPTFHYEHPQYSLSLPPYILTSTQFHFMVSSFSHEQYSYNKTPHDTEKQEVVVGITILR